MSEDEIHYTDDPEKLIAEGRLRRKNNQETQETPAKRFRMTFLRGGASLPLPEMTMFVGMTVFTVLIQNYETGHFARYMLVGPTGGLGMSISLAKEGQWKDFSVKHPVTLHAFAGRAASVSSTLFAKTTFNFLEFNLSEGYDLRAPDQLARPNLVLIDVSDSTTSIGLDIGASDLLSLRLDYLAGDPPLAPSRQTFIELNNFFGDMFQSSRLVPGSSEETTVMLRLSESKLGMSLLPLDMDLNDPQQLASHLNLLYPEGIDFSNYLKVEEHELQMSLQTSEQITQSVISLIIDHLQSPPMQGPDLSPTGEELGSIGDTSSAPKTESEKTLFNSIVDAGKNVLTKALTPGEDTQGAQVKDSDLDGDGMPDVQMLNRSSEGSESSPGNHADTGGAPAMSSLSSYADSPHGGDEPNLSDGASGDDDDANRSNEETPNSSTIGENDGEQVGHGDSDEPANASYSSEPAPDSSTGDAGESLPEPPPDAG